MLGEAPTVDFALVAVARALGLPNGAALTLFAIGRTIGWIGHAIEQYEKNAIIRPRAKYVGVAPVGCDYFLNSESSVERAASSACCSAGSNARALGLK